ncbi:hypothetical protein BH09BAC6_BH09BAC6_19570 [soil metagenome]
MQQFVNKTAEVRDAFEKHGKDAYDNGILFEGIHNVNI